MKRRRGAGAAVSTAVGTAVDAAVAGEVGAVATKAAGGVTKRAGRAARKAGTAAEQAGENVRRGRGPMTPARARRMIGLSKVVLPLLVPYALAAAGVALAVRAAEQMPPQRRKTAHRAVSAELDRVELTLLDHLGVGRTA